MDKILNSKQMIVANGVQHQLSSQNGITEDIIKNFVDIIGNCQNLTDIEKTEVIKELHSRLSIRMDKGNYVKDEKHLPWYNNAKKNNDHKFWNRYRDYLLLKSNFSVNVVNALDASTDDMMDLVGNPKQEESFSRKGLVIGDVQSGKTSNYTALINKASDAGYTVIILLTGTIEKLRKQTQSRLDEGFIGLDSTAFSKNITDVSIGVGNINPTIYGVSLTSTTHDFNKKTARSINIKLSSSKDPVLFVLKKNKSVLESLEQWLTLYNQEYNDVKIDAPMLLIDDEADNASVNTKKEDDDPTAINSCIRKLLKLFSKSSYVGFTATPFANVFINPDSETEMLEDDLFPKDFIYSLNPPSNYVGAQSIFSENGNHKYMLKNNDDCQDYIPLKHKKNFTIKELPPSLKEAIASFFISNAIRDLRGDTNKHRSMLINVSIYIDVQKNISDMIDSYVRECQREVKNYYLLGEEALEYETFQFIKNVYNKHFEPLKEKDFSSEDMSFTWEDIQKVLSPAIASIAVKYVNGGNASKNLNYDENEEEGLRLIAVGGYSLSRGLTLEGLCTSYFHRNSKMYDTLMQMGRWFGYRPNYESLCQVWLTEDASEWYSYISEASDELRLQVKKMFDAGLTPNEFGLAVRSDINTLLVTAINKMRTAQESFLTVDLSGVVIETPYFSSKEGIILDNLLLTETWIKELRERGYDFVKSDGLAIKKPQILDVPKEHILKYLSNYNSHMHNMEFNTENLVDIIKEDSDGTMDKWDIVIATGDGNGAKESFADIVGFKSIGRSFRIKENSNALQMSGSKSRLGTASYSKGGLTLECAKIIEKNYRNTQNEDDKKRNIPDKVYFNSGIKRNPLLVIYPVSLKTTSKNTEDKNYNDKTKEQLINKLPKLLIGLSVGIPKIDGKESKRYKYKINMVKYKELLDVTEDYQEIDESID